MNLHHHDHCVVLFILLILATQQTWCHSWGIFSSNSKTKENARYNEKHYPVPFSMEAPNNPNGIRLVENARNKLATASDSCWANAYRNLFAACSEIISVEENRSRFAWGLSNCFQEDSGRPPFPACDSKSTMRKCLKELDQNNHNIYLAFYLETNTICHQLQSHAFKLDTERLVNELKRSAQYAEDRLDTIQDKSEHLLQSSNEIHGYLISIDGRTRQLIQASKDVQDNIDVVLKHSEAVYEQSKEIALSQTQLQEGQGKMKEKMEEGLIMIRDSHDKLGQEITSLRKQAVEIEMELTEVGNLMSLQMDNLQSKANHIENITGISIDKQKELLEGQSMALQGLETLSSFQSKALEESRANLKQLAELSREKQEELLQRQEELHRMHDHLVHNSKTMLAAQEAFERRQTGMFVALDKLFALHNAMLIESRLIKAFFIYSMSIFVIYMFTSTKQTYTVRPRLYIGLCVTFIIEVSILRFSTNEIEHQTWIINLVRSMFALLSLVQFLHAIFTYSDYEVMNHDMLKKLMDKIDQMQTRKGGFLAYEMDESDDEGWSSLIDTEFPDDVNALEDPDYMLPEQVGENSFTTSTTTQRNYNLRQRPNR